MTRPWWHITWADVVYYVAFLVVGYMVLGDRPTKWAAIIIPAGILGGKYVSHRMTRT